MTSPSRRVGEGRDVFSSPEVWLEIKKAGAEASRMSPWASLMGRAQVEWLWGPLQGDSVYRQLRAEWWRYQMCLCILPVSKDQMCLLSHICQWALWRPGSQQGSHVSWAKVTIRHDGLVASSSVTLGKYLLFLGPNFPIVKMRGLDRVTSKALPSPTHYGCMALNRKVVWPCFSKNVINLIIW